MKFNLLALALALAVAFGLSMGSFAGSIADADADGIPDSYDNCINAANGPLGAGSSQCFTNQDGDDDGYGNQCDSDFNNDGATGLDDLTVMIGSVSTIDAEKDLNCDGAVGLDDLTVVIGSVSLTPGPSGLACSAANAKGTCPPL